MDSLELVLWVLGFIVMIFALVTFGAWIIERLKLHRTRTTLVLAWLLYVSLLVIVGVLGPLAFLRSP